jgi:hypothetical protein
MDDDLLFILVIDVDTIHTLKNLALLGYYSRSSGNFVPKFQDNLSVHPLGSRI